METVRMIYLDTEEQTIDIVEVKPTLEEYYKLLKCDLIEMPERYIGGKCYNIICDEEGTFKENPIISAVDEDCNPMLVGNILISRIAEDFSDVASLTDDDIDLIMSKVSMVSTKLHKSGLIVVEMDYYE